ncbi:MAG: hypothetical protein AAF497_24805 [Planctomycetota bacterium]
MRKTIIAVAVAAIFAANASAAWTGEDGTSSVMNPMTQMELIPAVNYDSDTGVIWIDTTGMNGINETLASPELLGDDIGMVSFQIESQALQEDFLLSGFVDGMVWSGMYFAGKVQMFGIPAGSEFLAPSSRTELVRMPTGLDASNFGQVEIGVNFASGVMGDILFNTGTNPGCQAIDIIPEPVGLGMAGFALLAFMAGYRRR